MAGVAVTPVVGVEVLDLPEDHPGFSDSGYRARRAAIGESCASYVPGGSIPDVHYTAEEDEVWRIVSTELAAKHRQFACARVPRGRRPAGPARGSGPPAVGGGRAAAHADRIPFAPGRGACADEAVLWRPG